jgi:hypothetical protein
MTTLPLNGRSYLDLLGLQTGVVPLSSDVALTGTVSGNLGTGNFSVNGQREASNSFLVNGGDAEQSFQNGAAIVPTLDSIQEFRLLTNSFDAEYGRFSGAMVNVVTKSGTNSFHGDLYEFLRNNALDSRNFFELDQVNVLNGQEIPGSAIGEFRQNQFGGTAGGPILKNRIFFFSDYQGTRQILGYPTGNLAVPSQAERGGDFSDVATTGHAPIGCVSTAAATAGLPCTSADMTAGTASVYGVRSDNAPGHLAQVLSSRLGYTVSPGEPYWVPGCNTVADAQAGTCVFPGGVIPQSAWSPAAKGTLQYIPAPSLIAAGAPLFSTSAYKNTLRDDKFGQRIDLNTQRTGDWSFYYHFDDAGVVNPYGGGDVPGFAAANDSRAQQFNLSNTHSLGGAAVNEARVNYTRSAIVNGKALGGRVQSLTDLGFVEGGLGLNPAFQGVPSINLEQLGITFGASIGGGTFNNTYQAVDNFSKIVGRHTLKFGGDFRDTQFDQRLYPTNGNFGFAGSETGDDFADYLLGLPDFFLQVSEEDADARSRYVGIYGQDSFKVRPNVTLNYGLRWEVSQPWWERLGRVQAFVPGEQSTRFPGSPTAWVFPGDPGIPKTLSPTRYGDFAPRLGLAYSPGYSDGVAGKIFGGPGRTSIRAASGIYYTTYEEGELGYETGNPPFGNFYQSPSLVYLEEPFAARETGANPGQRFPTTPVPTAGSDISFAQFLPISNVEVVNLNNVLPYGVHYNFSIQREIGTSMTLTVAYVGTAGRHLLTEFDNNPGNPALCLQIAALAAAAGQPGSACSPFGEDTIYNINGQMFNGTRPYSVTSGRSLSLGELDFGGGIWSVASIANSSYNSLQITLNKRVGALRLLGAYTYSKALDNASSFGDPINPFNFAVSKALSDFDMTHNFVVSYSYDLPFQKLSHSSTGAVHKFLQGWVVTGITRFSTGLPVTLNETDDRSLVGSAPLGVAGDAGVDRPNYNAQPLSFSDPRTSSDHEYFSTSQFSTEILGVAGNANRRFFHGPGLNNWDMSLHKDTRVTERISAEFRAEFFNAFNHTQFVVPVGDIASPLFGQVPAARDPRIGQLALKFYF